MKDRDNQFLFESYMHALEEGRKKKYADRVRQEITDPVTGEKRMESYYEMRQRMLGKGAGPRSRETRQRKEKTSNKVKLGKREFKVADKSYEERLNSVQKDIVRFIEADDSAKASDILSFLVKTGLDKKEAETVLGGMITDGYLDEINIQSSEPVFDLNADPEVPNIDEVEDDYTGEDDLDEPEMADY